MRKTSKRKKPLSKPMVVDEISISPQEINYQDYCIEMKSVDKASFNITVASLDKLWLQSKKNNKKPMMIIGIKCSGNERYVVQCHINKAKI